MQSRVAVVGGNGKTGRAVCAALTERGATAVPIGRADWPDLGDLGPAAAMVLLEDGHVGATYELAVAGRCPAGCQTRRHGSDRDRPAARPGRRGGERVTRPPLAEALNLQPHPEGGWYRQTWAAAETVTLLDGRVRPTATLIYFLLPAGESSAWHRVASDELWLAHHGAVTLELGGTGTTPGLETSLIVDAHEPQALVPAHTWQRTVPTVRDALVSCLVSPGFDFDDFELAP